MSDLKLDAREEVKKCLTSAKDMPPGDNREKIIAQALEHNKAIGELDFGAAIQNLYAAAKLTTSGSDNDHEIAAQFTQYVNNPMLVKIGQFRLSLETVQNSLDGSEMHQAAVNATLEKLGELEGADRTTALKELHKLNDQPLIDGAQYKLAEDATQLPAQSIQRAEPGEPIIPSVSANLH